MLRYKPCSKIVWYIIMMNLARHATVYFTLKKMTWLTFSLDSTFHINIVYFYMNT